MGRKRRDKRRDRPSGTEEPETPPPVRGWRIAFLVACTVGVCLSLDLLRLHVNVHTDPNYQSYCAMSERVNCNTVALSDQAVFLNMPVAVWGLFGYLLMAVLAIWGLSRSPRAASWPFGFLFWLAAFSSALGAILGGLSHFIIESVCIVCLSTYLVNFLLLFFAFKALRRVDAKPIAALVAEIRAVLSAPRAFSIFSTLMLVLLVVVWVAIPPYWRVEAAIGQMDLPVGDTAEGFPWIGAQTPTLEITEYSDYECPHCRRGHAEIRELIEAYPDNVRLVHRHYPLDQQCNQTLRKRFHQNACEYARMAYCAQQRGQFWQANDFLFENGRRHDPITIQEFATAIGVSSKELSACVKSSAAERTIQEDLAAGRQLNIRGTPTFVVNGEVYPGRIPPDVLIEALPEEASDPP